MKTTSTIVLFIFGTVLFTNCSPNRNTNDLQNISSALKPDVSKYDSTRLEPAYQRLKAGGNLGSRN